MLSIIFAIPTLATPITLFAMHFLMGYGAPMTHIEAMSYMKEYNAYAMEITRFSKELTEPPAISIARFGALQSQLLFKKINTPGELGGIKFYDHKIAVMARDYFEDIMSIAIAVDITSLINHYDLPVIGYILRIPHSIFPDLITKIGGTPAIQLLLRAGADLSHLSGDEISDFVKTSGASAITLLANSGIKPSSLSRDNLDDIIKTLGSDSIKPLADAGVRFADLDENYLHKLIKELGPDSIKHFADIGVKSAIQILSNTCILSNELNIGSDASMAEFSPTSSILNYF